MGDCGGCQVMSNPLVLHGTQISLPKPRQPLPRIPESTSESTSVTGQTQPLTHVHGSNAASSSQSSAAPQMQTSPPPFRSASNASMFQNAAVQQGKAPGRGAHVTDQDGKDRVLNADERLQRLKLRMQSTIEAYSGKPGNAAAAAGGHRYGRSQSLTTASRRAAFHRSTSSPVRASRNALPGSSRRATGDVGSCRSSSSSCSSVAQAGLSGEGNVSGSANGSVNGRASGSAVRQSPLTDDIAGLKHLSSKRGIPKMGHISVQHH